MNPKVIESLNQLISQFGEGICSNASRLKPLLLDFLGQQQREINLLCMAVESGITNEIRRFPMLTICDSQTGD